jgi:hypothetical protein
MKNDVLFDSGTCTYSDVLPKELYINAPTSLSNISYDCYMTNAIMSFIPTDETASNTYKITYSINYSFNYDWQSFNINVSSAGFYFNTNINNSTIGILSGSIGQNYQSVNYSLSNPTNYYYSGNGEVKMNLITSNTIYNQNNINTSSLITSSLTSTNLTTLNLTSTNLTTSNLTISNNFISRNITAGYLIDGASTGRFVLYPIICSLKNLNPNDGEDSFIINAGYRFLLFSDPNYGGSSYSVDNTWGTTFTKMTSPYVNTSSSIKVYYMNNEITLNDIS